MRKIFYIIVAIVLTISSNPGYAPAADDNTGIIIRVAIVDDKDSIYLSLKGKYKIYALGSERVVMEGPFLNAKVRAPKEGIEIGKKEVKLNGVRVKAAKDSNIYVDSRRFRGDIDILRKENAKLMVINYIALDDYLYGVLYHEVSHRWPMEALKAQAITARTFALYQAGQNKPQPYDLRSDIYSQVYGGRTSERWSTTKAVKLTRGKVLICKGELLPAYYHATCGGRTEDASNLWNVDLVPLKGTACDFCKYSPHYKWTKEIALGNLEDKLKNNGYKIGKASSVTVLSKNSSGRADKIEIKDAAGVSVILTGKDFRQIIGPNELRSTKFDLSIRWGNLIVDGFGWGHGVGMCQWGAYGMSKHGKKCEEILKHYYPGAEITTIDKISK